MHFVSSAQRNGTDATHPSPAAPPDLFVTVGTDARYSFDRLVDWADQWLSTPGRDRPVTLVQHGISRPARFADSRDFLSHEDMVANIERAELIVTHGGPGTIFHCWRCRKRPVVVPRLRALHEAVDDHQARFVACDAVERRVWVARTKAEFLRLLSTISRHPRMSRLSERTEPALMRTVARFEAVISDLVAR
jgi:UDP-N-acetylglucosamine transferase subunit ALG13